MSGCNILDGCGDIGFHPCTFPELLRSDSVHVFREKLCPLMIRLLGVPDKNVADKPAISTEEPVGQGQMAKFTLSPAVVANPEATRVLYQ